MSGGDWRNRYVFSLWQKSVKEEDDRISGGKVVIYSASETSHWPILYRVGLNSTPSLTQQQVWSDVVDNPLQIAARNIPVGAINHGRTDSEVKFAASCGLFGCSMFMSSVLQFVNENLYAPVYTVA